MPGTACVEATTKRRATVANGWLVCVVRGMPPRTARYAGARRPKDSYARLPVLFGAKSCVEKARKVSLKKWMLVSAIPAACGHPIGLPANARGSSELKRRVIGDGFNAADVLAQLRLKWEK